MEYIIDSITDIEIQIEVLKKIIAATDEEINNYEWVLNCISEYGIYPFERAKSVFTNCRYTENGIMQIPSEFAAFCSYISNFYIKNAIEIGVYRGRSSYIMCAILYRKNKNLKYYMVDIVDQLDHYEVFHSILPCCKVIPATSEDFKKKSFDFVFIDADHSYDGSMADFINVGQYTNKLVCFHDIFAHEYDKYNGGIAKTWKMVGMYTKDMFTSTFSQFPNQWMGIGVAIKNEYYKLPQQDFYQIIELAEKELENFNTLWSKKKKIYFYGTGNYGEVFYSYINKINKKIEAFVISKNQSKVKNSYCDEPVYYLEEIQDDEGECCFVLTLPECYQKEVAEGLRKRGYNQIYFCSDGLYSQILGCI